MKNGNKAEDVPLQNARIVQASVMDATSILLNFSNGSAALVSSEEIKKLLASPGAKILHQHEVPE